MKINAIQTVHVKVEVSKYDVFEEIKKDLKKLVTPKDIIVGSCIDNGKWVHWEDAYHGSGIRNTQRVATPEESEEYQNYVKTLKLLDKWVNS